MDLAMCGFAVKREELKIFKADNRKTPFKDGLPGKKLLKLFFKRHPELVEKEAESISKDRSVVTEESILKWFRDLEAYLMETGHEEILVDSSRIFNGGETGFQLCPKTGKVIAPRGFENVFAVQAGNEKENITVLLLVLA